MEREASVRGVAVTGEEEHVPAVVLDVEEKVLPVFVTGDQAQSIQIALAHDAFERPLTHDLFVDMLTEFGGAIDRVRIDELSDGTFYAKLDVERYDRGERSELTFDVRPSDAIAIAVRVDAPIFVADPVVEAAGREPDSIRFEDE
ncbi:MAG: bifunctional nuclease family protein [Halanaeroarchaeum sp.]